MLLALPAEVEKAVAARVQLALSAGVVKAVTAEVVALTAGVVKAVTAAALLVLPAVSPSPARRGPAPNTPPHNRQAGEGRPAR